MAISEVVRLAREALEVEAPEHPVLSRADADLVEIVDQCESAMRTVSAVQLRAIAEVERRGIPSEHGARNVKSWLQQRLRISGADAHARVTVARKVECGTTMTGQPAAWPRLRWTGLGHRGDGARVPGTAEDDATVAAARAGDESAFTRLVERYRVELRVHCYRMVGSFEDAEDLVQETFFRAWKSLDGFAGRSTLRAWLYRIATNACIDALNGRARRVLPQHLAAPSDPSVALPPRSDIAWLQPFPDRLCEPAAPADAQPEAVVVTRETIELAFLVAIQHLPPRQRAVLILRDVLGWQAKPTGALLGDTVASVNSALQRARATMKDHLPERRMEWTSPEPTEQERTVLRRYMAAMNRADLTAIAELLAKDVQTTMPPYPIWFQGQDAVVRALRMSWDAAAPAYVGRLRAVPAAANLQPSVAIYAQGADDVAYLPFAIGVLRIEDDRIQEITAFHNPGLFPAFGLPATLPPAH